MYTLEQRSRPSPAQRKQRQALGHYCRQQDKNALRLVKDEPISVTDKKVLAEMARDPTVQMQLRSLGGWPLVEMQEGPSAKLHRYRSELRNRHQMAISLGVTDSRFRSAVRQYPELKEFVASHKQARSDAKWPFHKLRQIYYRATHLPKSRAKFATEAEWQRSREAAARKDAEWTAKRWPTSGPKTS